MSRPATTQTQVLKREIYPKLAEVTRKGNLDLAFSERDLYVPRRYFYKDYCCTQAIGIVNLDGWLLSPAVFEFIKNELFHTTKKLYINDAQNIEEEELHHE